MLPNICKNVLFRAAPPLVKRGGIRKEICSACRFFRSARRKFCSACGKTHIRTRLSGKLSEMVYHLVNT